MTTTNKDWNTITEAAKILDRFGELLAYNSFGDGNDASIDFTLESGELKFTSSGLSSKDRGVLARFRNILNRGVYESYEEQTYINLDRDTTVLIPAPESQIKVSLYVSDVSVPKEYWDDPRMPETKLVSVPVIEVKSLMEATPKLTIKEAGEVALAMSKLLH